MRTLVMLFALLIASVAFACAGAASDGNLLAGAGFEDGGEAWFSLDEPAWGAPFAASDRQAAEGERSARLELRDDASETRVVGVVQDLSPREMPELLSGAYYVERWEQGTPKQYLQAVVIVTGAVNAPDTAGAANHQLRYILAGVDEPPLEIGNARYVLPDDWAVDVGSWHRFEVDLHADFERLWGAVPEGFTSLRVLFETRWDGRDANDGPSAADVYFDDLFLGSR